MRVVNTSFVMDWVTVVVADAIGIGVVDVLQMMRIKVIDYIFGKSNGTFYVPPKCS